MLKFYKMLENNDPKRGKIYIGNNSKKLLNVLSRKLVKPTQPAEQQKLKEI